MNTEKSQLKELLFSQDGDLFTMFEHFKERNQWQKVTDMELFAKCREIQIKTRYLFQFKTEKNKKYIRINPCLYNKFRKTYNGISDIGWKETIMDVVYLLRDFVIGISAGIITASAEDQKRLLVDIIVMYIISIAVLMCIGYAIKRKQT